MTPRRPNVAHVVSGAIAALALFAPSVAMAQTTQGFWDRFVGGIFSAAISVPIKIIETITWLFQFVLAAGVALFNYVISTTVLSVPATQYPIVQIGWRITRDIANMAFVLILLWIAFTIILRLEKYGDRRLIVTLILVALLVNFSMVITGLAIDISNRVMLILLNPITQKGDIGKLLLTGSNLKLLFDAPFQGWGVAGKLSVLAKSVFELFFTVVLAAIFLVLSALLVFRLFAFWRLLIMAPFAWISKAMPMGLGSGQFENWKSELIRWTTFGPKAAFWILIAAIAANTFTNAQYRSLYRPLQPTAASDSVLINVIAVALQYAVIAYFLFSAINAIKSTGVGFVDKALTKLTGDYLRIPGRKLAKLPGAAWQMTGVPGGVKQRWEQIKKSGLTIGGRQLYGGTQAREMREALVAQALGKRGAATRLEASRRIQDVKDLQEGRMTTLTNPNLVALLPVRGAPLPTPTEEMAAAAKELLTRRDYFDDIRARLGSMAEQAEYQHLREVYRRYIHP